MTASSSDDDDRKRLLELSEEVTRIAAALASLSIGFAGSPLDRSSSSTGAKAHMTVRSVDRMLAERRARLRFFRQELFAEPAWDMLLELFRCELTGRRISKSDLCLVVEVPGTTAMRWIRTMVEQDLVRTEPSRQDAAADFVALAPAASEALQRYFAQVIEMT